MIFINKNLFFIYFACKTLFYNNFNQINILSLNFKNYNKKYFF
jgi:hypothetical protein